MSMAALAEVIKPPQQVRLMFSANSWGWLAQGSRSIPASKYVITAIQIHGQVSIAFEGCLLLFVGRVVCINIFFSKQLLHCHLSVIKSGSNTGP